jgi:hypothetical protein
MEHMDLNIEPENITVMDKLSIVKIIVFILFSLVFFGCDRSDEPQPVINNIIPETFSINIPDALSRDESIKKSINEIDTLPGDLMYRYLTNFIRVGEEGAEFTEHIIDLISTYQIDKPMILSYESDADKKVKNLVVVENSEFDGVLWEFQMTITDADSEMDEDGGIGMQFFWNQDPVKGIALIKPTNLERINNKHKENVMYRIDYSEAGEFGYDAHMIVTADSLPMLPASAKNYAMKTMKMFVGKKGDIIDLYGNSVNPDAFFFTKEVGIGYNWAFVASANEVEDIGVAEVGLPKNDLNETSRAVLLDTNSMRKVLTQALYISKPNMPPDVVNTKLANTEAPGYFDTYGFVAAGELPYENENYAEYEVLKARLQVLCPYNPVEIRDLNIYFKAD